MINNTTEKMCTSPTQVAAMIMKTCTFPCSPSTSVLSTSGVLGVLGACVGLTVTVTIHAGKEINYYTMCTGGTFSFVCFFIFLSWGAGNTDWSDGSTDGWGGLNYRGKVTSTESV